MKHPADIATPIFDWRADQIARALERHPDGLTRPEISRAANIPRGSVEWVMRCDCARHGGRFERLGLVWRDTRGGRRKAVLYRLKPADEVAA